MQPKDIGSVREIDVAYLDSLLYNEGVVITNMRTSANIENKLTTSQAVTEAKIDMLAEDVKRHNNFASRMPVVEEQIKVINHRLDDLERKEA